MKPLAFFALAPSVRRDELLTTERTTETRRIRLSLPSTSFPLFHIWRP